MASKKVYYEKNNSDELEIGFTDDNKLFVSLYNGDDMYEPGSKLIILPLEDAEEIINDLSEKLKAIKHESNSKG